MKRKEVGGSSFFMTATQFWKFFFLSLVIVLTLNKLSQFLTKSMYDCYVTFCIESRIKVDALKMKKNPQKYILFYLPVGTPECYMIYPATLTGRKGSLYH